MSLLSDVTIKNGCPPSCDALYKAMNQEESEAIDYLKSSNPKWIIPEGLTQKISPEGKITPFYGDTVVYTLSKNEINSFLELQNQIRDKLDFLPEPLDPSQFHMTIHDLSNGPGLEPLQAPMSKNRQKCQDVFSKIFDFISKNPDCSTINLRSVCIYPSLNISILVGMAPEGEKDYKLLLNIYNLLDEIQPLSHWPRFHITLDYFKPMDLNKKQMAQAAQTFRDVYKRPQSIQIDILKIAYQYFNHMNDFRDQFFVGKL